MSTTITNPTSRARYTFSHLNNNLMGKEGDNSGYEAELIALVRDPNMSPLVALELFAQWEQIMACCDAAVVERYTALSKALRESAAHYLSITAA